MDTDPLADSVPPRHAIESDEEEDEYNPLRPNTSVLKTKFPVKLVGDAGSVPALGLLVATGAVGAYWARGANLSEKVATVMIDDFQIGVLYRPSWTQSVVLVSETTARLPLAALHTYAAAVLDALKPTSLALLDSYDVPAYISETRIHFLDAPLRFLATPAPPASLTSAAQPLEPPNLVQGASAAFISLRVQSSSPVTLLLVPAPHIAPAAPRTLSSSSVPDADPSDVPFAPSLVASAHATLFTLLPPGKPTTWVAPASGKGTQLAARKRPAESDFGMYI
ncbi:hypothetical protein FB45DRAFT_890851 [Roridomyces roridus]|uniref:Uncharacterized protein n=1 Tax=Roridomyces roridus TaxID=1738132 RepID=A0AAD7FW46_9AGAR|nr:hypothetical protein FB45DRAFT_890851 [Roridomyces roridus]